MATTADMWRSICSSAATTPKRAIPEPTERSIPPIKMTKVMPTPMTTISATCVVTLLRLPAVTKASRVSGWSARPIHRSRSTAAVRSVRELSTSARASWGRAAAAGIAA